MIYVGLRASEACKWLRAFALPRTEYSSYIDIIKAPCNYGMLTCNRESLNERPPRITATNEARMLNRRSFFPKHEYEVVFAARIT